MNYYPFFFVEKNPNSQYPIASFAKVFLAKYFRLFNSRKLKIFVSCCFGLAKVSTIKVWLRESADALEMPGNLPGNQGFQLQVVLFN